MKGSSLFLTINKIWVDLPSVFKVVPIHFALQRAPKKGLNMPRRNQVRGIVHDISGSFVSRNNDMDGYWAIGKLYQLAVNNEATSVYIDLKNQKIWPHSDTYNTMMIHYWESMCQQMISAHLPIHFVRRAEIFLSFYCGVPLPRANVMSELDLYRCTIEITTDFNRQYSAVRTGRCWPHDPTKERRRGRA